LGARGPEIERDLPSLRSCCRERPTCGVCLPIWCASVRSRPNRKAAERMMALGLAA
jgi:hypothetical protein